MRRNLTEVMAPFACRIEEEGVGIIQAAFLLRQGNVNEAAEVIRAAMDELADALLKAEAVEGCFTSNDQ